MPTAAANVLRDAVRLALQASGVATAAGVAAGTWDNEPEDGGHVFDGDGKYIGGRNRGRLPFLEFWLDGHTATQLSYDGGTLDSVVLVRVHVGGKDIKTAESLANEIALQAVASVRSLPSDYYLWLGNESLETFRPGPWGHMLDVRMTVRQAYGRDQASGRTVNVDTERSMFTAINVNLATIVAGRPVYVLVGATIDLADADAIATAAVAIAAESIATATEGDCQTEGVFEQSNWSAVIDTGATTLTPGANYFLSPTAGKITLTAPTGSGQVVQLIGTALSTTELDLRIGEAVSRA